MNRGKYNDELAERFIKRANDAERALINITAQLDAATARAEQAEVALKDTEATLGGYKLYVKSVQKGLENAEDDLETARRALEAACRYAGCKPRGAEENELLDKIANALATLTAPDGQQVTADGHVADEAALEVSNEAIRPKCQERLDTFTRMANGEKLG